MEWLAVKYKQGDGTYFVQSRQERENQMSVLIDEGITVPTLVIKTFEDEKECIDYCNEINNISGFLNNILDQ